MGPRRIHFRDHKGDDRAIQRLVVGVGEDHFNLMRSWRQTDPGSVARRWYRPSATGASSTMTWMCPMRVAVDSEGVRAEHRLDAQILGAILDEDISAGQRFSQRRIDDDPGRRLRFRERGTTPTGPSTSPAPARLLPLART